MHASRDEGRRQRDDLHGAEHTLNMIQWRRPPCWTDIMLLVHIFLVLARGNTKHRHSVVELARKLRIASWVWSSGARRMTSTAGEKGLDGFGRCARVYSCERDKIPNIKKVIRSTDRSMRLKT